MTMPKCEVRGEGSNAVTFIWGPDVPKGISWFVCETSVAAEWLAQTINRALEQAVRHGVAEALATVRAAIDRMKVAEPDGNYGPSPLAGSQRVKINVFPTEPPQVKLVPVPGTLKIERGHCGTCAPPEEQPAPFAVGQRVEVCARMPAHPGEVKALNGRRGVVRFVHHFGCSVVLDGETELWLLSYSYLEAIAEEEPPQVKFLHARNDRTDGEPKTITLPVLHEAVTADPFTRYARKVGG